MAHLCGWGFRQNPRLPPRGRLLLRWTWILPCPSGNKWIFGQLLCFLVGWLKWEVYEGVVLIWRCSRHEEDYFKTYPATILFAGRDTEIIDFFFLMQVAKERKMKYSAHHDPIHDQVHTTTLNCKIVHIKFSLCFCQESGSIEVLEFAWWTFAGCWHFFCSCLSVVFLSGSWHQAAA